jgi:hypothetical protein
MIMSAFDAVLAWAINAAKAAGLRMAAASPQAGPAGPASPASVTDIVKGGEALAALVSAVVERSATLSTVEDAANAIQTALVELGIEPPQISAAIRAAEWLLPILFGIAKTSWGDQDPFAPRPAPLPGEGVRVGRG